MTTDKLTVSGFAAMSGLNEDFITSHPAILKLVRKAIKEDWLSSEQGKANFQREFEQTPWYQKNAKWARGYLMAQAQGGADFEANRETTAELIKKRAMELGAVLPDSAVDTFVTGYYMGGWGEKGREGMLDKALVGELEGFDASHVDFNKGGPQAIIMKLKATAAANGVDYSDSYFESAAKAVLLNAGSIGDYESEIRQQAATLHPQYANRIMAGEDARDIYSPYISIYAKMFDKDPASVRLDDPNLKMAFNATDSKGTPAPLGLWDYEKALRKSDGWQYTKQANDEVSKLTRDIVRMFGFGG